MAELAVVAAQSRILGYDSCGDSLCCHALMLTGNSFVPKKLYGIAVSSDELQLRLNNSRAEEEDFLFPNQEIRFGSLNESLVAGTR